MKSHDELVYDVLAACGEATTREITAQAVTLGLRTTDRHGAAHRVRTVLQRLKAQGKAHMLFAGKWAVGAAPPCP